jgi:hypothetical protein
MTTALDTCDTPADRGKATESAEASTLRRCNVLWRKWRATVDEDWHYSLLFHYDVAASTWPRPPRRRSCAMQCYARWVADLRGAGGALFDSRCAD